MKKIDVIDLAFKIIGIYIVVLALSFVKDLHYLRTLFSTSDPFSFDIIALVLFILSAVLLLLLGYFLIFKSHIFSRMIIKDDSEFNLNLITNKESTLELTLVIFGIIILIFRLPAFIIAVKELGKYVLGNMTEPGDYFIEHIGYLLQYILGYFLITNSRWLAVRILRISRQKNT